MQKGKNYKYFREVRETVGIVRVCRGTDGNRRLEGKSNYCCVYTDGF